jgi:hypothetical protein
MDFVSENKLDIPATMHAGHFLRLFSKASSLHRQCHFPEEVLVLYPEAPSGH